MHAVSFGNEPQVRRASDTRRVAYWQIGAWCVLGYLLVLAAWAAPPRLVDSPARPAHGIKAAFLYKFLDYVEWPAGALGASTAPVVIGVLGDDGIADELQTIVARRRLGLHPLEVRRVVEASALDGVRLLFIGSREPDALARLAPAAQQRSILVVTDFDDALETGSVINLITVDDRVRFEVSLEAAERSGLRLSSRMLGVAMWVRPSG
jgi:hypothetical protein